MNNPTTAGKKYGPRKSKEEWVEINALWEKSQKPRKEFCAELGISDTSFAYWRQRLKKENPLGKACVAFAVAQMKKPKEASFCETSGSLKIDYPNGIVLNLYCELNSKTLSILRPLLEI